LIQIEKDAERDKYLEGPGLNVLRVEKRFVFQEPEYVLSEIRMHLKRKLNNIQLQGIALKCNII
jgi:very-short-patch-repair endonuclease